jgi:hypothetical protein
MEQETKISLILNIVAVLVTAFGIFVTWWVAKGE